MATAPPPYNSSSRSPRNAVCNRNGSGNRIPTTNPPRYRYDQYFDTRTRSAIEAKGSGGGTVQATFDLGQGEFTGASADGGGSDAGDGTGTGLDPATEAVLDELRGTDVNETPPVELMATVQAWQERLEE